MDFEEIKKLLELGGGRCAIYREGESGYIILTAAEFQKIIAKKESSDLSSNNLTHQEEKIKEEEKNFSDFQLESDSLEGIKIEDLPL